MASTAYEFLADRQDRLAHALKGNTDVANFVQATLEHLIDRAEARGIPADDIAIESPQIVQQGNSFYIKAKVR